MPERFKARGSRKIYANSQMPTRVIEKDCQLDNRAHDLPERAVGKFGLSPRACHGILKVACTIADIKTTEHMEKYYVCQGTPIPRPRLTSRHIKSITLPRSTRMLHSLKISFPAGSCPELAPRYPQVIILPLISRGLLWVVHFSFSGSFCRKEILGTIPTCKRYAFCSTVFPYLR